LAAPAAWQTTPATCPAQVRPACRADCPAAHVCGRGWAASLPAACSRGALHQL
jgi:hypothetical protein